MKHRVKSQSNLLMLFFVFILFLNSTNSILNNEKAVYNFNELNDDIDSEENFNNNNVNKDLDNYNQENEKLFSSFIDLEEYYKNNDENKESSNNMSKIDSLDSEENIFLEKSLNQFLKEKGMKSSVSKSDLTSIINSLNMNTSLNNKNLKRLSNVTTNLNNDDCSVFNFCNGNGSCVNSKCVCNEGYTNYDCSISK